MFELPQRGRARNPAVLSPLIAGLFSPGVIAAEMRMAGEAALLDPREAEYCSHFAPKRVAEFSAGRLCAHRALAELEIADQPILVEPDRRPRWPSRVVGSITHTHDFCAAAVADSRRFASIGIDAETIGRITPEIRSRIFTQREEMLLDSLDEPRRARATTVIFSAKEAFYKCQYHLTQAWRDFHDVSLDLVSREMRAGDFVVFPSSTTAITVWGIRLPLRGRFQLDDDLVVTGIAV